jgi:phage FluMu gp28-like protein
MKNNKKIKPILLPYQITAKADKSDIKVYEKSRRIGMSWLEACDSVLTAAKKEPYGMDVWYIGYNKDMSREFINDCAFWALKFEMAISDIEEDILEDRDKNIQVFKITFANGHKIVALSSRPTELRGKKGKAIIDEAAFHADLSGLLKAAKAFLIWGGKIVIISTHNGDDNDFNDLVNDIRAKKIDCSLHRITFDDAISQGLGKRIFQKNKKTWSLAAEKEWREKIRKDYGDDAEEELDCNPRSSTECYISRAQIVSCQSADIPVFRWICKSGFTELPEQFRIAETNDWCQQHLSEPLSKLNQSLRSFFGEDFARNGARTFIHPVQQLQNQNIITPFAVELSNVPFEQQKQILFYIADRLPNLNHGALDARGNGQYLAEVTMQRYGKDKISEVMLSDKWYRENMPLLRAAFEDKTITIPKDVDILADYRALRMTKGVAKIPDNKKYRSTDGGYRHGDAAIAGALAVCAVYAAPPFIPEHQSTGKKRKSSKMKNYTGPA